MQSESNAPYCVIRERRETVSGKIFALAFIRKFVAKFSGSLKT